VLHISRISYQLARSEVVITIRMDTGTDMRDTILREGAERAMNYMCSTPFPNADDASDPGWGR
jgi:hypothetical protein